jgi:hypothetical protein
MVKRLLMRTIFWISRKGLGLLDLGKLPCWSAAANAAVGQNQNRLLVAVASGPPLSSKNWSGDKWEARIPRMIPEFAHRSFERAGDRDCILEVPA